MQCRRGLNFVRFIDRIHEVHVVERKTPQEIYVVRVRLTRIQATTRPGYFVVLNLVQHVESSPEERKASTEYRKTKSRSEDGEYKETMNKRKETVGDTDRGGYAF